MNNVQIFVDGALVMQIDEASEEQMHILSSLMHELCLAHNNTVTRTGDEELDRELELEG
jgi:hypothetical protein